MKRQADGTYVASDTPVLLALGALAFALTFALGAWHRYEAHEYDIALASLVVLTVAAALGTFAVPGSRFVFDPARKQIRWGSRSLFKSDGGVLAYSDVDDVSLQSMNGSSGAVTYRVALHTKSGTVPLSAEYSGNRDAAEQLADAVRALLGMPHTVR